MDTIHVEEKSLGSSIPHRPKILITDELDHSKGSFSAKNGHSFICSFHLPGNSVSATAMAFGIKQDIFECVFNLLLLEYQMPLSNSITWRFFFFLDPLNILTYTWYYYRIRNMEYVHICQ